MTSEPLSDAQEDAHTPSPDALAAELDLMEKAAALMGADAPAELFDAPPPADARFEDRVAEVPEADDDEDMPPKRVIEWSRTPSVRDQETRYPGTTRHVEPETKVLDLSKPKELEEFNRIQRANFNPDNPTLAIIELDRQPHNGSWAVFVTYCQVQYQKLS